MRESVKAGSIVGTTRAPGSSRPIQRAHRVHERRVGRRGVADDLLGELELVAVACRATSWMRARTSSSLHARRRAAVDGQRRPRGDHVDLVGGEDARRRERDAEHRLDDHREDRVALAQRVERRRRVAVEREAERGQQRARRLGDVVGRLAVAHRLQEAGPSSAARCRPSSASRRGRPRPSVRQREAKDALLGHAHAVEALVAEREDRAGALVEQHVAAHRVGVVLGQPDRALAAAGLLVDDADDEQVAVGGAPARRGPAPSRRRPRPRSGTSCPARRGPRARRRRRRPTTGRAATRRGRRGRCRRARAGTASARRRSRAGAPRGWGAPRCARAARPRSPRRAAGRRAAPAPGARCPAG